jgi:hypothetical protein
VKLSVPCDSDPTARRKRRAKLTGKGRRRGPAVLDLHGEALLAGFGGDGLLDDVQESTARLVVRSLVSRASCNSDGA